jgi:tRNA(Ile)-lysidine synthase
VGDLLAVVRRTVDRYRMLSPGDRVVVAVSGGPDSVALAHLLLRLSREYGLTLHVAHLDHQLRGAEAAEDARFVARLAEEWGLPATVEAADVPGRLAREGGSAEAVAREERYAFLERVAAAAGASRVALGHHVGDVAETVLMNLLRGTGPRGLGGIPPVRAGRYIRPLIEVDRSAILAYLEEQGLPYRVDPSNTSPAFLRNRVRHELLPYLERRFAPDLPAILGRTAALLRAEDDYLEEVVGRLRTELGRPDSGRARRATGQGPAEAGPAVVFPCAQLAVLHPALLRRLIRQVWAELAADKGTPGAHRPEEAPEAFPGEGRLSFERVEAVAALVREGRTGSRVELPAGVVARRRYAELVVARRVAVGEEAGGWEPVELKVPGAAFIAGTGMNVRAEVREVRDAAEADRLVAEAREAGPWAAVLDLGRLEPPLVLRPRQAGDRFRPLGAPGGKKLKEVLIEAKLPAEERDRLVLLADRGGERVVWVAGLRPAEPARVDQGTKRALLLQADFREL